MFSSETSERRSFNMSTPPHITTSHHMSDHISPHLTRPDHNNTSFTFRDRRNIWWNLGRYPEREMLHFSKHNSSPKREKWRRRTGGCEMTKISFHYNLTLRGVKEDLFLSPWTTCFMQPLICGFSGLIFWPSEPRTQYVGVLRGHGTYLTTKRKPVTDLWFRALIHVHTWSSCAHERLHFKRKEFGRTWLLCWSTAHLHLAMKLKGWVKSNSQEALSLHIFTAGPSITGSSWIFLVGPSPAWSHPPPFDI